MNATQQQLNKRTVYIIYFAIMMSQIVFGFMYLFIFKNQASESIEEVFKYAILFMALVSAGVGEIFHMKAKKESSLEYLKQGGFAFYIISWFLAESVSLFGLILGILGAESKEVYSLIATGLILLAYRKPSVKFLK